jgi:hypothetical protein
VVHGFKSTQAECESNFFMTHHGRELYDLGEDVTVCWASNETEGSSVREDCAGAGMRFDNLADLPSSLWAGHVYDFTYTITVPAVRSPLGSIPHANVHSCLRNVGFCTPFVASTTGLATHSAALTATLSPESATMTSQVQLDVGQYTVIIHGRWFDASGLKHDMARATLCDVSQKLGEVRQNVKRQVPITCATRAQNICFESRMNPSAGDQPLQEYSRRSRLGVRAVSPFHGRMPNTACGQAVPLPRGQGQAPL